MRIAFTKMHGLGNDFVVVDLRGQPGDVVAAALDGARIRALADRHTGIGFDQWLTLHEPRSSSAATARAASRHGSRGTTGSARMCGWRSAAPAATSQRTSRRTDA